jgi:hypothetical protein
VRGLKEEEKVQVKWGQRGVAMDIVRYLGRLVGLMPPPPMSSESSFELGSDDDDTTQMLLRLGEEQVQRHRYDQLYQWSYAELCEWYRVRYEQYAGRIENEGRAYYRTSRVSTFFTNNERMSFQRMDECYHGMHRMRRRVSAVALLSIAHYRRGGPLVKTCLPRDVMIMIARMVAARRPTKWPKRNLVLFFTRDGELTSNFGFCTRECVDDELRRDPLVRIEWLDGNSEEE